MLNRQTLTRATSSRAENPLQATKKLVAAATAKVAEPTARRAAFKDISNVTANANAQAQAGRVKKLTKAPSSHAIKVPAATKAVAPKAASNKRPAESEADEFDVIDAMEVERSHKKRKSEPSTEDRMQLDEESVKEPAADAHEEAEHDEFNDVDAMEDAPIDVGAEDVSGIVHEDIDLYDCDDPQAVVEYVDDIYAHMRSLERKYMVNPRYMANQVDVNEKMRAILVDWLVEVHRMFKLLPETLFLAVNLIDRFLENKSVARDKLQLVGVTAMLIASKYEEIYAPECNDFVYISDGAYTKEQILQMEQLILSTLQFNLNTPSPLHFLRRFSKAAGSDYNIHTLCKYLIELTIMDMKLLKYPASSLAAAAVYIARAMHGKGPFWNSTLHFYTHLSEAEVRVIAQDLNGLLKKVNKSTLKAIKKKYAQPKFGEVSNLDSVDL